MLNVRGLLVKGRRTHNNGGLRNQKKGVKKEPGKGTHHETVGPLGTIGRIGRDG